MIDDRLQETLLLAGLRPPRTLTFAITGACNLRCRHCLVDAGGQRADRHVANATVRRLISEFAALGGEGVCLTGGEPLCHPQWLEFLQLSRTLGFSAISLQTNAMLLDADQVERLAALDFPGLVLQISVDGASAANHDLVRGAGAFHDMLNGIRLLAGRGLSRRVSFFFTEMRHNLLEVPELLQLAEEYGVGSVVTGTLVPGGRAASDSVIASPEPEQYRLLLERYRDDALFRERYRKMGNTAALEWYACSTPRSASCTFIENPYLTSAGRLYPCVLCHADPFSITGVFHQDLEKSFLAGVPLWSELQKISDARAMVIEPCRQCPQHATCAAGCMGRAWGSSADLFAVDDRCRIRRMERD